MTKQDERELLRTIIRTLDNVPEDHRSMNWTAYRNEIGDRLLDVLDELEELEIEDEPDPEYYREEQDEEQSAFNREAGYE